MRSVTLSIGAEMGKSGFVIVKIMYCDHINFPCDHKIITEYFYTEKGARLMPHAPENAILAD